MNSRRLRLWLAVLVFFAAVVVIILSLLPSPRIQQVLPVPPVILPTPIGTPTGEMLGMPPLALWEGFDSRSAAWRSG